MAAFLFAIEVPSIGRWSTPEASQISAILASSVPTTVVVKPARRRLATQLSANGAIEEDAKLTYRSVPLRMAASLGGRVSPGGTTTRSASGTSSASTEGGGGGMCTAMSSEALGTAN